MPLSHHRLSPTVLRALKSGPVIPTNDRDREEKPSDASAAMPARLQAKRLAGLAAVTSGRRRTRGHAGDSAC